MFFMKLPQVSNFKFQFFNWHKTYKTPNSPIFCDHFSDFPLPSGWIMEHTMRRSSLKSRITRITRLARLARNLEKRWMRKPQVFSIFDHQHFSFHHVYLIFPWTATWMTFFSSAIFDLAKPPFFWDRSDAVGSEGPRAQQHPHHAEAAQEAGVGQALG